MAEYSLEFADTLIRAADGLEQTDTLDERRAVAYLSLLACEIGLKALLEKAGMPIRDLVAVSHRLSTLQTHLSTCTTAKRFSSKTIHARVTGLRAKVINVDEGQITVGTVLDAEKAGASKYPTEIRYGDKVRHYPPAVLLQTARHVLTFAREHWDDITYSPPP